MVVIVGAGVIGLSVGWRLCQQGWPVTILERDEAGAGASTAAAGMLAPTAEVRFEETQLLQIGRKSLEMWPEFAAELTHESGIDVDYRTEGTLVVGLDRDDAEALDRLFGYHAELKLPVEKLSGDALREREPGIHPTAHSGLWIPSDHQVDPVLVIQALKAAFLRAGGILHEHCEVSQVVLEPSKSVVIDGGDLQAEHIIVAAGAWSRKIPGLPDPPYVRPVKGQMLSLELGEPPLCTHVIRAPDAYLVPKSSGRLVVGATMEEMGFDARKTAGGIFELLRGAWETLPGIYDAGLLDTWTGFRPMTLDNLPVIQQAVPGLHYVTGHGRGGILLTPWTCNEVSVTFGSH